MEISVIYEDADVCVVNKPYGLIVHSDGRTEEPTLADWVLARYPETREVGEPWTSPQGEVVPRPGIVHRLDRTTSGVMVLAKNKKAYEFLKQQFQGRLIEKTYRAFVYGHPKEDHGVIEKEIVRIRSTPPRWGIKRASEEKKHRAAITEWRVLERGAVPYSDVGHPNMLDVEHQVLGEKVSYLELYPKTGRTHQLRVHLKHAEHPIICDPLYAQSRPCLLGFTRPALHAFKLKMMLPSGEEREFEAPLPPDFHRAIQCFIIKR